MSVRIAGNAPPDSLKLDVTYKNVTEVASISKLLDSRDTVLDPSFAPTELHLWLISREGFLADFHDENEYWSRGSNAVPRKRQPIAPQTVWAPNLPGDAETLSVYVATPNRVFVIHGRNTAAKESIARVLEKLGVEAVVLHEQANQENTIIEKFELPSGVGFAVALLTGDDEGRISTTGADLKKRPRQNVLFEFGYFIGKLGRNRVCALMEEGLEIPSDYNGVVYILLDQAGRWKMDLVRELKAAGFDVDANACFENCAPALRARYFSNGNFGLAAPVPAPPLRSGSGTGAWDNFE